MILSRSFRWSGAGICNGRQRLWNPSVSKRNLATNRPARGFTLHPLAASIPFSRFSCLKHSSGTLSASYVSPRYASTSTTVRALPENASTSSSWTEDLPIPETSPEAFFTADQLQPQAEATGNGAPVEYIGFLKDFGLDFGWGPTSVMQFWLEHVHIWADLPWTSCVILTAFVTRMILFRPLMKASHASSKLQELSPILQPLRTLAQEQLKNGDKQAYMETVLKMKNVQKASGAKTLHIFLPMLYQFPMGYSLWRLLRNLAEYEIPSLETESFLWITDLTHHDPYFILPVTTSLLMWYNMKTNAETGGSSNNSSGLMKGLTKILPFMSGLFFSWQPAIVQVNFLFTTFFIGSISALIRHTAFRQRFGLAAIRKSDSSSSSSSTPVLELRKSPDGRTFAATGVSASYAAATAEDKNALDRLITRFKHWRKQPRQPRDSLPWWRSPRTALRRFADGEGAIWDVYSSVTGKKASSISERRDEKLKSQKKKESVKYERERRDEEEAKRRAREMEAERMEVERDSEQRREARGRRGGMESPSSVGTGGGGAGVRRQMR